MKYFKVEEKESVVHLRLDRGGKYNALDVEMLAEFVEALK